MPTEVNLVGFDIGTTTTSAVVASAQLAHNSVTGRTEITSVNVRYRSEMIFTPRRDDGIDVDALGSYLDDCLAAGRVGPEEIFGGGALLTGLAAQGAAAQAVVRLVKSRLRDALVATADDPCLESWLAFMGSSAALSRAHPNSPLVNLDIGGGTTNLALGVAGQVLRTGCLFVGARHVQVEPGSYRVEKLSRYARALFEHLGIPRRIGHALTAGEVDAVLDFYMNLLEAELEGAAQPTDDPLIQQHRQVAFQLPGDVSDPIVTVSGGVGELVYAHLRGQPWPAVTHYGDLGIDLARRLVAAPKWAGHFRKFVPASAGRATVYGLLRYNTEVSGSTLFLPRAESLPLADVPVLGTIAPESPAAHVDYLLGFARRSPRGGAFRIELRGRDGDLIRDLGRRMAGCLAAQAFPAEHPLVLLVSENLGKVLGNYVTDWGAAALNLVVIDEIDVPNAEYVQIGRLRNQVVPVAFYGLREESPAV